MVTTVWSGTEMRGARFIREELLYDERIKKTLRNIAKQIKKRYTLFVTAGQNLVLADKNCGKVDRRRFGFEDLFCAGCLKK